MFWDRWIRRPRAFTVGGRNGDFATPAEASRELRRYRFTEPAEVVIHEGVYRGGLITGHDDMIRWKTPEPPRGRLKAADLVLTGNSDEQREADRLANEALVRSRYPVILEFTGEAEGFAASGRNLGRWGPLLAINVGATQRGIQTGTSERELSDGSPGLGAFDGVCTYGFEVVNIMAKDGGALTDHDCLHLFGKHENSRTDFAGVIRGHNVAMIGGGDYNHRANHGGARFSIDAIIWNSGGSGVESTNSAGMVWINGADVRGNRIGVSATYGGSVKAAGATIEDNATEVRVHMGGCVDARRMRSAMTSGKRTMGLVCDGGIVNAAGAVITGHRLDISVTGPGGVAFTRGEAGVIRAGGKPVEPDSDGWIRA